MRALGRKARKRFGIVKEFFENMYMKTKIRPTKNETLKISTKKSLILKIHSMSWTSKNYTISQ